ncbi:hypothetical protein ABVT39_014563 [Epinephelus coioides]
MEKVVRFLRERRVDDTIINEFVKEKIDTDTVLLMDDETMKRFLPALGDRVALKRFCEGKQKHQINQSRKQHLLETLRRKMKMRTRSRSPNTSSEEENHPRTVYGQVTGKKTTRRIELGWIHNHRQVRARNGGGTRKLTVSKETDYEGLLQIGKDLFFPEGQSTKGSLEDFTYKIWDFKENEMPYDCTVGAMYEKVKMGILRFYLASFDIESDNSDSTACLHEEEQQQTDEEDQEGSGAFSRTDERNCVDDCHQEGNSSDDEEHDCVIYEDYSDGNDSESSDQDNDEDSAEQRGSDNKMAEGEPSGSDECDWEQPGENGHEDEEPAGANGEHDVQPIQLIISDSDDEEIRFGPVHDDNYASETTLEDISTTISPDITSRAVFTVRSPDLLSSPVSSVPLEDVEHEGEADSQDQSHNAAPSSSAQGFTSNDNVPTLTKLLRLRRVNIIQDMLAEFAVPQIMASNLTVRFVDEIGVDASGITRDAFSAFWTAFFESCSDGLSEVDYFPIQMSFSFAVALVFGEGDVTPDMLMESFLRYLTEVERETIQAALHNSEINQEDLLDIFCRMGSHTVPSKDNLKEVLLQIAHKQLIQEPNYALEVMAKSAQKSLKAALPTVADLQGLYSEKTPTANKVLSLLSAEPTSAAQNKTMQHLRLFIRSLDSERLSKFLRFVTGADVLCVNKISIQFSDDIGLQRRPVAYTCGPLLQLPCTYSNYTEFRREILSVIDSQWLRIDLL